MSVFLLQTLEYAGFSCGNSYFEIVYFSLLISLQDIPLSCSYNTQNYEAELSPICRDTHTLFRLTNLTNLSYF